MQAFLFDLVATQPNIDGDFHGGGKYGKKIFFELASRQSAGQWKFLAIFDSSKELDGSIIACAERKGIELIDVLNQKLADVVNQYGITRLYTALPFSLVPYGFNSLNGSGCEIYVTIHGLRTLEIPVPFDALHYLTDWKSRIRLIAQKILQKRLYNRDKNRYFSLLRDAEVITVSNHTKYSVLAHFPGIRGNVSVFYSPDVTEFENTSPDPDAASFNQSGYFLLVSGNRWLKNNLRSAQALDELFTDHPELTQKVIITGVKYPQVYLRHLKNKERFIFHKYVSESFLRKLYHNAFAFLYMSLNEGFGYPPLDAMKAGVPVITSPFTSIPEICGDAVLYANPYSKVEIKNRILQLFDPALYQRLTVNGKERFALISHIQKEHLEQSVDFLLESKNELSSELKVS